MIEHAFANIARSNRASLRLSNSKNPVCPCLTAEIRKLRVAVLGEEEPRGPQRSTVEDYGFAFGSNSSALASSPFEFPPPAASTFPLGKSVAVYSARATFKGPVRDQV